jgi:hypothetical protein
MPLLYQCTNKKKIRFSFFYFIKRKKKNSIYIFQSAILSVLIKPAVANIGLVGS